MPKYNLSRSKGKRTHEKSKGIEAIYQKQKTAGEKKFQKLSDDVADTAPTGDSLAGQIEPLFQAGVLEFVFSGKEFKDRGFPESYNMEIDESFDKMYRTGKLTIINHEGLVEFTSITNTWDNEYLEITLRNKFEGDVGRAFKFALCGMDSKALDGDTNTKRISFKLYEEPFFTKLHRKVHGGSYRDNTASQIISSIMASEVKTENLKIVPGDTDPKFPSWVIPNWSAKKTISYLQNYGSDGPIKVFNVSKGDDTVTVVASLGKLLNGDVYPVEFDLVPSVSSKMAGPFQLGPYKILGPTGEHVTNSLSGETVMTMDYFSGKDKPKDLKDFPEKESYKFETGNDEFKIENRSPASLLSGTYKEGLKISKHLGEKLLHQKEDKGDSSHGYFIDVDPKNLVEAKMFNRFSESYLKGGMTLYTIIMGHREVNVGQIWNIQLPSSTKGRGDVKDETLSGKWILWKIKHKIRSTSGVGRTIYEMHCWFLRTGLELSNRLGADSAI